MSCFICTTCGTQYAESPCPPGECAVCVDERQYVAADGQRWTTHAALAATHGVRVADDDGVLGLGVAPAFAIPQRAVFVPTREGNLLWECLSLVTDEAVAALRARGGVAAIAISHPHFHASMLEWSEALGGVPIYLHSADRDWVRRPSPRIEWWSGPRLALSRSLTLLHVPGHFPGSAALHWREGPRGRGALLPGDALQVTADRRHVSFMYSYPNLMPLPPSAVRRLREAVSGVDFDDVYGYTWGRNIVGGGRAAVEASFDRYLAAAAA
jgi:glyoxylase-like metal-dependent hydrolase (beta-lactamase superfamily II)